MCYWEDRADLIIETHIKERRDLNETIQTKAKNEQEKTSKKKNICSNSDDFISIRMV